jgi:hypothetical protein
MASGSYQGKDAHHPEIRQMFSREYLLDSEWYQQRLAVKQQREIALWQTHIDSLQQFLDRRSQADMASRMDIKGRLELARERLQQVETEEYLQGLIGTIGADPLGS